MDEEKNEEIGKSCPLDCPNRAESVSNGFLIFGRQFKPVESLLHVVVLVILLAIISNKAYKDPNFGPKEAFNWIVVTCFFHFAIGIAPTQRLETFNRIIELKLRK
ncbi:MAG TPA: hypothetical protein V6C65_27555 [Allocoleopsis sp.]